SSDTDNVCSGAFDIRAHTVQEIGNVHYMRFSCRILNDRTSGRQRCRHHDIDRSSHRNHIQENMTSMKILCFRHDRTVNNLYFCAQSPESFQMLVNRTTSDIASSRKRNLRMFIFTKEGSQKIIRCTYLLDIFIIKTDVPDNWTVVVYIGSVVSVELSADI